MERGAILRRLEELFRVFPVVALIGPRQCGKTTVARQFSGSIPGFNETTHYFDLDDPLALARLDNPVLALGDLKGQIVIDEIQSRPDLFPYIRMLVDRPRNEGRYLMLGSASPQLLRQSAETLAGRIVYLELTPFSLSEISVDDTAKLWLRGGFPKSFLAESDSDASLWMEAYIRTFLERDLSMLGFNLPPTQMRTFWTMLSHYHGRIFSSAEIGRSLGVAHTTVKRYLDALVGTFMMRELQPWFENVKKRQVRSPKVYCRDSGLYHRLAGIGSDAALRTHPQLGASWEGFALEQVIRVHQAQADECFFWGVHEQGELDLLIVKDGLKRGFEFKYADAPRMSRSLQLVQDSLQLDELTVVYPGEASYLLTEQIQVKPLAQVAAA